MRIELTDWSCEPCANCGSRANHCRCCGFRLTFARQWLDAVLEGDAPTPWAHNECVGRFASSTERDYVRKLVAQHIIGGDRNPLGARFLRERWKGENFTRIAKMFATTRNHVAATLYRLVGAHPEYLDAFGPVQRTPRTARRGRV